MNESEPSYSEIFLEQLINSLEYVANTVHPAIALDEFTRHHRDYALTVLELGLKSSVTWKQSRTLLSSLATLMEQSGLHEAWLRFLEIGMAHAIAYEEWDTLGELEFQNGFLYHLLGRFKLSEQHFRASSEAFQRCGDSHRAARSELRTGIALVRQKQLGDGIVLLTRSLPVVAGNPLEEGYFYYAHYLIAASEMRFKDALEAAQHSFALWRETHTPRFIGWGLANLGLALFENGQQTPAETHLVEALTYLHQVNDPLHIGVVQLSLGNIYLMREDYPTALKWYSAADSNIRSMQNLQNIAYLTNNLGMVYHGLEQWESAQAFYEESIDRHHCL
jgi:tetratricopeptide (TPR) repeat protein